MPPPSALEESLALADELRPALRRLYRRLRRENDDSDLGLSPMQKMLLIAILESPGISVGDLARMEKLRGPTISGHIKALASAGLIAQIAADLGDRRRISLFVSDQGHQILETMRQRRRDWLAQRLATLSQEARQAIRDAIGPLGEISQ